MKTYAVIYSVDGVEHFRNIESASSPNEARKMAELAARWKNSHCEVKVISVQVVDKDYKNRVNTIKNKSQLFQYGDLED
jgi:hypothetical protein|tara:strand:+ start:10 stop:246 length:237 start_codon:yes stop_codon:yes gene_type:complete